MRRRRGRRPPRHRRAWPGVVAGILAALALCVFVHGRLRPVMENMATYQVKVFAARILNQALLEELANTQMSYEELVTVTQDRDGLVTSVQTDMVKINLLKSQMSKRIVADLEARDQEVIQVPLGTLLGNDIFSGRGPSVELKVVPTGYLQSEIYNEFSSAGINQTHHQVMLRTTVQMMVFIPGYAVRTETTTNFCLAETVIVGTVPDAFTQINGDDAPLISKINDYEAGGSD